jgi:hypothetical protein
MKLKLFVLFILVYTIPSASQDMPHSVKMLLDARFSKWRIVEYSLPKNCIEGKWARLYLNYQSFYKCNLNGDSIPDYAIRFVRGNDSTLIEYFVAILSKDNIYDAVVLDSCFANKGAGNRYLQLLLSGAEVNIFDDSRWEEITKFGKLSDNKQLISFPVDALIINPICEAYYKAVEVTTFVWINNRFIGFSSAD